MNKPYYFNHNSAYYYWIKKQLADCNCILDVGCGDGTLVGFLDDGSKKLVGIDADEKAIKRAEEQYGSSNAVFINGKFEETEFKEKFDAVVFVASLHHMDMTEAFRKTKSIMKTHGRVLIVGLAAPSTAFDWLIEGLRVLPVAVISKVKGMKSSEELDIAVSYELPELDEIRELTKLYFPGRSIRQGLFYRYLMSFKTWI